MAGLPPPSRMLLRSLLTSIALLGSALGALPDPDGAGRGVEPQDLELGVLRGPLYDGGDGPDVVWAGRAVFTAGDPPRLAAELEKPLRRAGRFEPGWFVVHFEAAARPVDRAFLDALTGPVRRPDGSELARWYLPNDAFGVWVDDEAELLALEGHERVDWVGRFQPAYKLDPTLGRAAPERRAGRSLVLNLDLVPGHPAPAVEAELAQLGIEVLERVELRGERGYDVRFLVARVAPEELGSVAWIEGVRCIQEAGDGKRESDLSGGGKLQARALTADDGSASPVVTAAAFPLWVVHDLQGQGQLVGVVDSSLDWGNAVPGACGTGFPDGQIDNFGFALPNLARVALTTVGAGGVSLKIPRATILGGATLQGNVGQHGVGVAGAAVADFYGDDDTRWWEHDVDTWKGWAPQNRSGLLGPGIAHEAQLFFAPTDDSGGNFRWEQPGEFETNMGTALDQMAAADVSVTNHSVGLVEANDTYTQTSVVHDTKAWDHPLMLQCMAAGNNGAGTGKLNSQAVVKNALTVGASDDVLNPEARAPFSSTGPTFDGRIKPDLLAPGDDTTPREHGLGSKLVLPDSNGLSTASCASQTANGTSFAAPLVAGAAALVHQYFEEGRYAGATPITDPSAALMKAVLMNRGHRLTGANLGAGEFPSAYQGWGEPVLDDALWFPGDSIRLVAWDVDAGDGFASGADAAQARQLEVLSAGETLRITLAWTDAPGTAGPGKKLVNDLDLVATSPTGTVYRGSYFDVAAGVSLPDGTANTLDNVEQILLPAPEAGVWTIAVDAGSGSYFGGQGYALVATGDVGEPVVAVPPVAAFAADVTLGPAPLTVQFSDLSTGDVTDWSWDFGDLAGSTDPSPQHTYTAPGTYDVTLTVSGPGGVDSLTLQGLVQVEAPFGQGTWFVSFDSPTYLPGVGIVQDEDVAAFDLAAGAWSLYFDGSDVGLADNDVDALHVLPDGDIVVSLRKPTLLPALQTKLFLSPVYASSSASAPVVIPGLQQSPVLYADDSDLLVFDFSSRGPETSGQWLLLFDGSDVGMEDDGEDLDGVHLFPDGRIALSTNGKLFVPGNEVIRDEDIALFVPTELGSTTSGTWSKLFDGGDVGLNSDAGEDIDGIFFDALGNLVFSTLGDFAAAGTSGGNEDMALFSQVTSLATLLVDLSALGVAPFENVDAIGYQGPSAATAPR